MLYIRRLLRRLPQRYRKGGARPRHWVLGLVLLAVLALTGFSEWGLAGVSPALTEEAARGYVLERVAQAVEQELAEQTEPFVTVERDGEGQVSMVSARPEQLNRLRTGVVERLGESLRGRATVYVPAGSLTGISLLNGRGFPVPIALRLEGSAEVEFSTDFLSAGVNQTCHRLVMTVRARAFSQSRRFETSVEAQSGTVLAETLVVGQVPEVSVTGK